MSETLNTIGKVLTKDLPRDAVHIAVLCVELQESKLKPGDHVGYHGTRQHPIGIIDPFLPHTLIQVGTKVWVFLYPNTITSLKHLWTHPDIPDTEDSIVFNQITVHKEVSPSKVWIENYADMLGITFDELMEAAHNYISYGEYLCRGGQFEGEYTSEEFWDNYEQYKKIKLNSSQKTNFFSCSC